MTPRTIGPHVLEAELGSGGMGTVWRATGPEGTVALKVAQEHVASNPRHVERFLRGVLAAAGGRKGPDA
jgi:hypothetical protein